MLLAAAVLLSAVAAPEQVHVAHRDTNSIWVSWLDASTGNGSTGFAEVDGQQYPAMSASYQFLKHKESKKDVYTSPGIFHAVVPATCGKTLAYRVQSANTWSANFTMNTVVCPGNPETGVALGLIGDLGQTKDSEHTTQLILDSLKEGSAVKIDQVWLMGDLSYADASETVCPELFKGGCHPDRWDSWGKMIEPLASRLTLQVLPGNHEPEKSPKPEIGVPYVAYDSRMRAPTNGEGAYWYSWESGNAHMISLNSYMAYDSSSAQYQWLEKDLQSVDRSKTPWIFVGTHAPWYNSNTHHHNEVEEIGMRESMEPLMKKYNVDVLFCGHVHAYERTLAVYNNTVTPGAMVEFNIGDGGNREDISKNSWISPQPAWSAFRKTAFGHGIIQTLNSTHAKWTWHTITSPESVDSDEVMVVKNSFLKNGIETGVETFQL